MTGPVDTEIEVALLKQQIEQNSQIFAKIDNAIEKITILGNDITRMLALHEQRLDRLEKIDNEIHGLVEQRRAELQTDIKYLDGKLASTIKEISDDLAETEDRLLDAIKDIKTDISKDIDDKAKSQENLENRVAALERWRWMLVGGGTVAGYLASKFFPFLQGG